MMPRTSHGCPDPLGAAFDPRGTNFALFSRHATHVDLCFFDEPDDATAASTIPLARTGDVWHVHIGGIAPGQLYGYRVYGPYQPDQGHDFDPRKLLLDPYARAIAGRLRVDDSVSSLVLDDRDTTGLVPKGVVIDPSFDWEDDRPPRTPWNQSLLYECHVKGLTFRHSDVPAELRGTYLGLASPPILKHLRRLGVTALELLPVHHSITEPRLTADGLVNYWGYNTLGFFAPDARFATGDRGRQVQEFKQMVKTLHRAGIEVILDVVYNHTAEGDPLGPTLSFRGIDNAVYYRLDPQNPRRYLNFSGCGNTLDTRQPQTARLILDSLRYWVEEMHVDGFRIDLASALTRDDDPRPTFFDQLRRNPVLGSVKLIAEPWDATPDGYRLGSFPPPFVEWNDKFHDTIRRFWRGDAGQLGALATRLAGSADLFGETRGPMANLNFAACHDGFTLHDLVSYEKKHNDENLEGNRDGSDQNDSRNCGVEGPTDDPQINKARDRAVRNLIATVAFAQGVLMLQAGDEMGRTQRGNNNAYCQDNDISWMRWPLDSRQRALLDFACGVFQLRRRFLHFRRSDFFSGAPVPGRPRKDATWLRPDGGEMTNRDWADPERRIMGMWIADPRPYPACEDVLLILNAADQDSAFALPQVGPWTSFLDTADSDALAGPIHCEHLTVRAQSLRLLVLNQGPSE